MGPSSASLFPSSPSRSPGRRSSRRPGHLVSGRSRLGPGTLLPAGERLVDPLLFSSTQGHLGARVAIDVAVPADVLLVHLLVYTQGPCGSAPAVQLSNALGSQVGS